MQSISGQAGKTLNPVYSYDLNGNIVSVVSSNGVQRTHTWTSFDNPDSFRLSQDNVKVDFLYGPEHQRIREISSKTVGGVTTVKTLNVLHPDNEGGLYFEREDKNVGGVITNENRHYLSAEKGAFLLITSSTPIPTATTPVATSLTGAELRYWHKDHLGSIVASTNSNLGVIERMAYDPFGKRRALNGAFDQTGAIDATSTSRGFTGHEHLDELDFIHMNARVYDPDIGRFLSADPTVPDTQNPQSFNRYSYVINNPLNRYDPSGFADIAVKTARKEGTEVVQSGRIGVASRLASGDPFGSADAISSTATASYFAGFANAALDNAIATNTLEGSPAAAAFYTGIKATLKLDDSSLSVEQKAAMAAAAATMKPISDLVGAGKVKAIANAKVELAAIREGLDASATAVKNGLKGVGDALRSLKEGSLPRPPTGPGKAPRSERDPKRFFTPAEREAKRAEQGHVCGNGCGTNIDESNSAGHHIERHSDGGRSVPENHSEVCTNCHKDLHSGGNP